MALRDNPYLPLYIQDFMTDEKLIECSPHATGIYIRLMCVLHKSEVYGKLSLKQNSKQNDKQIENQTEKQIKMFAVKLARHTPYSTDEIEQGLIELMDNKVLYIEGDCLCQKRMVKDGELSLKRSIIGSKGGSSKTESKKECELEAKTQAKELANAQANILANADNDNDIEYNINIGIKEGVQGEKKKVKYSFDFVWNLYDKKIGDKNKLAKKWDAMSKVTKDKILEYIPRYIGSQPEKRYRKNFDTFLNNSSWEDEIIKENDGCTKAEPNIPEVTSELQRDYNESF